MKITIDIPEEAIAYLGKKVMDEYQYRGFTIREWADLITNEREKCTIHAFWNPDRKLDEEGRIVYHCTHCNFEVRVYPYELTRWRSDEKFCPHCGATMGDN